MHRNLEEMAALERSQDRRPLLARKLATDSAMLPGLLILELTRGIRCDPAALLRYDFEGDGIELAVPAKFDLDPIEELAQGVSSALGQGIAFEYRSERTGAEGEDFPVLIHWLGHAAKPPGGRDADAKAVLLAHWFEPFLGTRQLDFPLNPELLKIEFSSRSAMIQAGPPSNAVRSESFGASVPPMINPGELYDLFDSLRVAAHLQREPRTTADGRSSTIHVRRPPGADGPQSSYMREVDWRIGPLGVTHCSVWQPLIMMPYESPNRLVGEARVEDQLVGSAEVVPVARLEWFPGGLEVEILFDVQGKLRGGLPANPSAASSPRLPSSIDIRTRGGVLARSVYRDFHIGDHAESISSTQRLLDDQVTELYEFAHQARASEIEVLRSGAVPTFDEPETLGATDPLLARWRLRVNLLVAARLGDQQLHDRSIDLMQRRLRQDGVALKWAIRNAQAWVQELAGPMDMPGAAIELALPAWLALMSQADPETALSEVARLAIGGQWAFALLAARTLEGRNLPPGALDWINRLKPLLSEWARGGPMAPVREGPLRHWTARTNQVLLEHLTLEGAP
ncbi:MAG: hypothetical protein KF724_08755 [Phycisphaeraceae bacterium]|nr:hypothetical protein [Phycisphaeraceae bacterium]